MTMTMDHHTTADQATSTSTDRDSCETADLGLASFLHAVGPHRLRSVRQSGSGPRPRHYFIFDRPIAPDLFMLFHTADPRTQVAAKTLLAAHRDLKVLMREGEM